MGSFTIPLLKEYEMNSFGFYKGLNFYMNELYLKLMKSRMFHNIRSAFRRNKNIDDLKCFQYFTGHFRSTFISDTFLIAYSHYRLHRSLHRSTPSNNE